MNTFNYLLLGCFDSIAMIALMFKIYRFPFWEYAREIAIIAAILSFSSYVVRFVIGYPEIDTVIQLVLFVIMYRYIIKFKLYYAVPLAEVGYLSFAVIQFLTIPLWIRLGIANMNDLKAETGTGTYLIQISTDLLCYLVAFLLYRFGLGFSHIFRPPHEVNIKVHDPSYGFHVTANIIGTVVVSLTMYWMFATYNSISIIFGSSIVALGFLMYLSHRKDYA